MDETDAPRRPGAGPRSPGTAGPRGPVTPRVAYRVIPCAGAAPGPEGDVPALAGLRSLGALLAVARDGRLTELSFCDSPAAAAARGRSLPDAVCDPEAEPLPAVAAQLAEYFVGRRRRFDLPLAPDGTPFQRAVWDALLGVPWGRTRSYGDLARAVGRPGAARAIGGAMNRNPIAIVVPCHRIVGSDGSLTGYGAGLGRKEILLTLEGVLADEGTQSGEGSAPSRRGT